VLTRPLAGLARTTPSPKALTPSPQSAFQAGGAYAFADAISENTEYRKKREAEKHRRIEALLETRQDQFRAAGFWGKQAILKSMHVQVNREFCLSYSLF
jgi:hypothetical protein